MILTVLRPTGRDVGPVKPLVDRPAVSAKLPDGLVSYKPAKEHQEMNLQRNQ